MYASSMTRAMYGLGDATPFITRLASARNASTPVAAALVHQQLARRMGGPPGTASPWFRQTGRPRRVGYTPQAESFRVRSYYSAGGFFSSIGKALKGLARPVLKSALSIAKGVPIIGTAISVASDLGLGGSLFDVVKNGTKEMVATAQGQHPWIDPSRPGRVMKASVGENSMLAQATRFARGGAATPAAAALTPFGGVEAPRRKRRRKGRRILARGRRLLRGRRRHKATGRTRHRRMAGDYGEDWSGSTPSRDKRGRYLTRAGGRHHHRKHRRHHRRHRGGNVSFTTKSGKRVSFHARGDD